MNVREECPDLYTRFGTTSPCWRDRAKAGALCRNMVSLIAGRECRIPLLEA
jgi:hypothetical protein